MGLAVAVIDSSFLTLCLLQVGDIPGTTNFQISKVVLDKKSSKSYNKTNWR
jgi:hypothetical protein